MSKKKWLIGASTCFLVLGLAACSSGESEKASGNEKHSAESSEKKSDDKELNVDAKFDKEKTDKFYNTVTKNQVKLLMLMILRLQQTLHKSYRMMSYLKTKMDSLSK